MKYPIKPVSAADIELFNGDKISIDTINERLKDKSKQSELLELLGFQLDDNSIKLSSKETGKAYVNRDNNPSKTETELTTKEIILEFNVEKYRDYLPLDICVEFDKTDEQDYINFLGQIKFKVNKDSKAIVVPITGKGTAALEGRIDDAHAGLCTGGACASFQQKVAIFSVILACFSINRDEIEVFRAHFLEISGKYHGRDDILNYTIDKAFNLSENQSYFEYMLTKYPENIPLMLKHFVDFSEPHPKYFELLKTKLSETEYNNAMNELPMCTKKTSSKSKNIINKLVLHDDLYLVKPLNGNDIQIGPNETKSILEIAAIINENDHDKMNVLLEKLGLMTMNDRVKLNFYFQGEKWDTKNKSTNQISEEKIEMDLNRSSKEISKKTITLNLDHIPLYNINCLGKIEIKLNLFQKIVVPLFGRGTIDINGIVAHDVSNLSVDAEYAAFQQKVAIIYTLLVHFLNVDQDSLTKLHENLLKINEIYFNRSPIILEYLYSLLLKLPDINNDYFQYSRKVALKSKTIPVCIKTMTTYNRLPSRYYEELLNEFTEDDLMEEKKLFEDKKNVGFIGRLVRRASNLIANF